MLVKRSVLESDLESVDKSSSAVVYGGDKCCSCLTNSFLSFAAACTIRDSSVDAEDDEGAVSRPAITEEVSTYEFFFTTSNLVPSMHARDERLGFHFDFQR